MKWLAAVVLIFGASAQPPAPPAAIASFASRAAEAQQAERFDQAVGLYQQALAKVPSWQEGWWQIGMIEYGRDRYPQCRDAFKKFTMLNSKLSVGFAFLGLCEFQTREFAPAVKHMESAAALGLPEGEQVSDVVLYHLALLHTKGGNFERALQLCNVFARRAKVEDKIIAVAGTAALRKAAFPYELTPADQQIAARLGTALLTGAGRPAEETLRQFEAIVAEYPATPNIHYTFSTLLLANEPERAIAELKKELEISPGHLPSLVSLAIEYLNRGEPASARPFAEQAIQAGPGNFAARATMGRVLLETEGAPPEAAIRELEAAVKIAPDSPQAHVLLASAYSKAGRMAAALRERNEFARLKRLSAGNSPEAK